MPRLIRRNDLWALAAFALWLLLLCAGLLPDWTFRGLRAAGNVLPQYAWVNNALFITVSLSAYLAIFTWQRCLEEHSSRVQAKAHGLQIGFLSLIAFAPIQPGDFQQIALIADGAARANEFRIIGSATLVKIGAWLYLFTLLARYYLGHNYKVFANMTTLIPSARSGRHERAGATRPSARE